MPRTQIEKLWLGGGAVVAALIAVIGYFFLVAPQRGQTQHVRAQVADAQLEADTLQSRIVTLTSQQKELASYRIALVQARAALPTLDDLSATPTLLRSLQAIAHRSSTTVSSLTVGDPTAITPTAPAAPTASGTSTAPSSSTPVAAVPTTPAVSLYSVAITAAVNGSPAHLVAFLTRLQHHQPRAVFVSAVAINAQTTGGGSKIMTLTMTAFVRPPAAAATTAPTTAAVVAAPSTTATP